VRARMRWPGAPIKRRGATKPLQQLRRAPGRTRAAHAARVAVLPPLQFCISAWDSAKESSG
jgi:hypothetical protein